LGASKTTSKPMVRSAQTVHQSCVKISTISKWTKTSLWYCRHKSCTYLAQDSNYLQTDRNKLLVEPCHLGRPLGVSKTVGVRSRGGPKPTSECCMSLTWMVMQGEHTGVYPGSGRRRPYVQRGGESCISLHRGACVGVTSLRERAVSPSLKERKKSTKMIA
jgi:hypothetical protein